jgi:hypothetical protein
MMLRILTASALLLAAGAGGAAAHTPAATPATASEKTPTAAAGGPQAVVLETALGAVVIKLAEAAAPKTSANFKKLVKQGFYDGTCFHRVIAGFMIQGTRSPRRSSSSTCAARWRPRVRATT